MAEWGCHYCHGCPHGSIHRIVGSGVYVGRDRAQRILVAQAFGAGGQCAVVRPVIFGGSGRQAGRECGIRVCFMGCVVGRGLVPVPRFSLSLFSSIQLVALSFGRLYHSAFAPCVLRASCDLVGILLPAICSSCVSLLFTAVVLLAILFLL